MTKGFRRPTASDIPSTPRAIHGRMRGRATRLSRSAPPPSSPRDFVGLRPPTSLPRLRRGLPKQKEKRTRANSVRFSFCFGGEEGIRTPETGLCPFGAFRVRCLRPLGHFSGGKITKNSQTKKIRRNYLFFFSRMRLRRPWERLTTWVLSERSSHSRARSYCRIM